MLNVALNVPIGGHVLALRFATSGTDCDDTVMPVVLFGIPPVPVSVALIVPPYRHLNAVAGMSTRKPTPLIVSPVLVTPLSGSGTAFVSDTFQAGFARTRADPPVHGVAVPLVIDPSDLPAVLSTDVTSVPIRFTVHVMLMPEALKLEFVDVPVIAPPGLMDRVSADATPVNPATATSATTAVTAARNLEDMKLLQS
ncbi:hypothetical protein [Conexibacter woesei]|uniref:hypothetical protein n=1 Tax=Conexibacter woesei TaxID=191495 RepID=UPI0005A1B735|nr:hypothetical protein [Conexibacter woesei]